MFKKTALFLMDGFPNEGDANNARNASNAINSRITSNSSNLSNECNSSNGGTSFPALSMVSHEITC